MPLPDDGDAQNLARLKSTDSADLARGVSSVEGMTPEEEAAHHRKSTLALKKTIHYAKRTGIWTIYGLSSLVLLAMLFAFCRLLWVYVADISAKPEEVKLFLHEAVEWLIVAFAALFIDRRLRD